MIRPWLVLTALLLAIPGPGSAQESPPPPAPASLKADWWSWFQVPAEELPKRIAAFNKNVDDLARELQGANEAPERESALELVREVKVLAARYGEARARGAAKPGTLPPAAQQYRPSELLQVGTDLREARLELEFERDEASRQEQSLRDTGGHIDDEKAAHLALASDAPQYLVSALSLIRDRFIWAIGQEDLRLRRARVEALKVRAGALEERLATATARLAVTPEVVADIRKRLAKARQRADTLRRQTAELRLRETGLGESAVDRARARLQSQRFLNHAVLTARAALDVSTLELQDALAAYVASASEEHLEALRQARRGTEKNSRAQQEQARVWRRSTIRERSTASDQIALASAGDAALAAIHEERLSLADSTLQDISRLDQELADAALLTEVATKRVVQGGGHIEEVVSRASDTFSDLLETARDWTTASLFEVNETPVTAVGLLRVAFILLLAWWVSKLLSGAIGRLMERRESMSRASLYTLQRLSTYLILAIGFFVGLSSIGIDFTRFALVISALGVGLGFGLQAIFSNFVAGLIILFEKSLKVGDFVELESGVHGEVREVNIRSTLITTNDNVDILVPNSEFVNGRVTNWTLREAYRRIRVSFGVAYGSDKELVKRAALEAAEATPYTLKNTPGREPRVWLVGFGDSSLDFELVVWLTTDAVKRPGAVQAAYNWELESALARHGLEIPFPQRDLHLRSAFGASGERGIALLDRGTPAAPGDPPPHGTGGAQ